MVVSSSVNVAQGEIGGRGRTRVVRGVVESHSVGKCACGTQRTRNAEERAPEERARQRFEYFARGLQVGEGQRASND